MRFVLCAPLRVGLQFLVLIAVYLAKACHTGSAYSYRAVLLLLLQPHRLGKFFFQACPCVVRLYHVILYVLYTLSKHCCCCCCLTSARRGSPSMRAHVWCCCVTHIYCICSYRALLLLLVLLLLLMLLLPRLGKVFPSCMPMFGAAVSFVVYLYVLVLLSSIDPAAAAASPRLSLHACPCVVPLCRVPYLVHGLVHGTVFMYSDRSLHLLLLRLLLLLPLMLLLLLAAAIAAMVSRLCVCLVQVKNPWSRKRWTGPYSVEDTLRWTPALKQ